MKGVILAAGKSTRLKPLTGSIPKPLLPVYNKPIIFYGIQTLIDSGISDILIVCSDQYIELFRRMIGNTFNVPIKYTTRKPAGTADALLAAEDFVGNDPVIVLCGDNVFEDNFKKEVAEFQTGAEIFIMHVSNPEQFGVVELDGTTVVGIEEKPKKPKSNHCSTGLYIFDNTVYDKIKKIEMHENGEYYIPDVLSLYIKERTLKGTPITGFWFDVGTFDSLLDAGNTMKNRCQ